MTALTADEQKAIVRAFFLLDVALNTGLDIEGSFQHFQTVYRGDSRAYVDGFSDVPADERRLWLFVLKTRLFDEIEPDIWNAPLTETPPVGEE